MTTFGAIQTSGSGLHVMRRWMDAVADNMANLNTVRPMDQPAFQQRMIVAESVGYGGAAASGNGGTRVAGVAWGNPEGRLVHEPGHPMADEQGYVRYPDVDMGDQMVQMMLAQRGYQANLSVVDRAREAYQAALQLGK
jgi:flagellar basal-body rod protein FlgC